MKQIPNIQKKKFKWKLPITFCFNKIFKSFLKINWYFWSLLRCDSLLLCGWANSIKCLYFSKFRRRIFKFFFSRALKSSVLSKILHSGSDKLQVKRTGKFPTIKLVYFERKNKCWVFLGYLGLLGYRMLDYLLFLLN